MAEWTTDELERIGGAEEIGIASRRADGTMRPFVTIWAVRAGDDIYVRSAHGSDNPWYRRALASGEGRIRARGAEHDVRFEDAEPSAHEAIDAAYHAKYDRYGARIVGSVAGEQVHGVTLRLVPKGDGA